MKNRSKPRYKTREKRKERPLDLTPANPRKAWAKAIAGLVLSTVIPYAVLWGCDMDGNPYRVLIMPRPSDVRLDGKPVTLDSTNQFEFSRWTLGEHLIRYRDAQGEETIRLHPRLDDDRSRRLLVRDGAIQGVPQAEFVR